MGIKPRTRKLKKTSNGKYLDNKTGKKYELNRGSRAQVFHETAYQTNGNLLKKDLMKNKHGDIVSKAKHVSAKKEKRLLKAGYGTQKGKFGFVRLDGTKSKKSKSMKKSRKTKRK